MGTATQNVQQPAPTSGLCPAGRKFADHIKGLHRFEGVHTLDKDDLVSDDLRTATRLQLDYWTCGCADCSESEQVCVHLIAIQRAQLHVQDHLAASHSDNDDWCSTCKDLAAVHADAVEHHMNCGCDHCYSLRNPC